jgi:hypothetical protein
MIKLHVHISISKHEQQQNSIHSLCTVTVQDAEWLAPPSVALHVHVYVPA